MFRFLLLLFLLVPLIEIYLLIKIGSLIGAIATVFLVVLTAVVGAYLLRLQGFATLQRVRKNMSEGVLPAQELIEGLMLLFAGVLLLTPGFFTDIVGFVFLVPAARHWLSLKMLERSILSEGGQKTYHPPEGPRTLEGDFHRDK
ncbi:MAG: FxsA family protein [Gammaproteobacteria bacterium]|nr:FxsA family protein [Gammaproteobacteria bacterium]